jgi:Flp pilus assembly protein TadG
MLKLAKSLLQRRAGESGMAAVEFALIAPIMMLLFFGLVETCNALNAHQKVTAVASTAADLTSQATQVSKADLADIYAASSAIMSPFSASDVTITISSITGTKARNIGKVVWSQTNGKGTAHTVGSTIIIGDPTTLANDDTGLLPADCDSAAQCSLIFAEVSYNYTSPYGKFITGVLKMADLFYSKPRRVVAVTCTDCAN